VVPPRRIADACSNAQAAQRTTNFTSSPSPKVWKSGLVRPVRIRAYSQELAVIALQMFAVVLYKCLVVAAHTVILLVLVHTAHTARTSSYCSYCSCCSYYSYPDPVPQFFSAAQWYSLVATPIQYPSFFCCCSVVLSTPIQYPSFFCCCSVVLSTSIQYPDPVVLCLVLHFYNGEEEVSC
jgi:hypothetical protein